MQYFELTLLSIVLMLSIFIDIQRFPLLRKGRGSRFFCELAIVYSIFIIISLLVCLGKEGYLTYPLYIGRIIWTLHFISFPFLLSMWMHFNAINVIDDVKLVTMLTRIHVIPLVVLSVIAVADITEQRFYPMNPGYEHLLPVPGTYFMIVLSIFYCLAMILPTLGHRKDLQGSFLFVSMLMPITFLTSIATFWMTHSYAQFMMVNSFMMVLNYLVGQRDSLQADILTGLPTEALLKRKLIRIFRFQSSYSVILLDIENFRYFNARYGQLLGDKMLISLSAFLSSLGSANEVFRIESDRFCLCISDKDADMADTLVATIRERMNQSWELEGTIVFIQVNIAVINIPQQAANLEEFKRASDQILLELKTVRKKSMIVYTRESTLDNQYKLNVISALRESVRLPEQVQVYYQPIYEVKTGRLISAEALMRIEDKHLGFLQPGAFIPLAEQTGLIVHLTQILLTKVCQMVKRLPKNTLDYISVNLSGEDFGNKAIGKTLLDNIEKEGVEPRRIGFEITESVVLQSYEAVADVMIALSSKEISFALDDFGSGYSNLRALIDLPYDYVKFDRTVIQSATANPKILILLTEMLHKMQKCIIAEGVETEEELALIREVGIERVQGFIFAKPMEENDFLELVRSSYDRPK